MNDIETIKSILIEILKEGHVDHKIHLIRNFQNIIWEEKMNVNNDQFEILSELAYDLDFFVADDVCQKEDVSYYGQKRLTQEINDTLLKL